MAAPRKPADCRSFDPQSFDHQSFDRCAADYDRLRELTAVDPSTDWLRTLLPDSGGRALDLGCGAGWHAVVLAERFAHVDAVDLSGPMLDIARARRTRPNISYRQADLRDVDGVGRYDFVWSCATLHHVADLDAALRHIRALAAPGGRVALVDTVSPRPANPRWWLYGGEVRKLTRNLYSRGPGTAWEIFRLSTGPMLDHRVSDRYLSREGLDRAYRAAFATATGPQAWTGPVGTAHALRWDAPPT